MQYHGTEYSSLYCNTQKVMVLHYEDVLQRPGERAVLAFIVETGGRINAAGLQFLSRILPLEAEARLDLRGGMDALHCAASHGHWRFNRATCLHRLPRRYTRRIVLLQVKGRQYCHSDYQDLGLASYCNIAIEVADDRSAICHTSVPTSRYVRTYTHVYLARYV